MTRKLFIAGFAVFFCLTSQGFAQSRSKESTDIAKKFTAIPDGSGTTRFYDRDGSSSGRAAISNKTTRFYGKDGIVGWPGGLVRKQPRKAEARTARGGLLLHGLSEEEAVRRTQLPATL